MMAIEGKVFAQFIVDDDGSIQDIQIVRSIKYGCDEAAKNVINSMNDFPNKWTPGKHRDMNVPVLMTIPVEFKLDDLVYEDVQHKPYLFDCSHLSDAKAKGDCTKSIISSIGHRLVKYPAAARQKGVQGEVILGFVIDKNGKMEEMEVIQGIGSGCDEAAMDAFKNLSNQKLNWVPARQNNTNVNYLYRIPVQFKLGG
jgi:TonB family protein